MKAQMHTHIHIHTQTHSYECIYIVAIDVNVHMDPLCLCAIDPVRGCGHLTTQRTQGEAECGGWERGRTLWAQRQARGNGRVICPLPCRFQILCACLLLTSRWFTFSH